MVARLLLTFASHPAFLRGALGAAVTKTLAVGRAFDCDIGSVGWEGVSISQSAVEVQIAFQTACRPHTGCDFPPLVVIVIP